MLIESYMAVSMDMHINVRLYWQGKMHVETLVNNETAALKIVTLSQVKGLVLPQGFCTRL